MAQNKLEILQIINHLIRCKKRALIEIDVEIAVCQNVVCQQCNYFIVIFRYTIEVSFSGPAVNLHFNVCNW